MRLLVAAPDEVPARALADALRAQGMDVAAASACRNLVREAVRAAPVAVVVVVEVADATLFDALDLLQVAVPVPVLLFAARYVEPWAARALAAGVVHAAPAPCEAGALAVALPLACALHGQLLAMRRTLAETHARLEERKWVDKAKGVLMSARGLSEREAFTLLRTASMQSNLRVGEVSRALIEAAEAAEALTRVGQLRCLSQCIVKAGAQYQAGIELAAAATFFTDALASAQASIDHMLALQLADALQPLVQDTLQAWQTLRLAAAVPPQGGLPAADALARVELALLDQHAEALLAAADRLTGALEAASGRPILRIVNLCARQRMLVQRVAKQALLAYAPGAVAERAESVLAQQTVAELDAALAEIEQSPLRSEDIRATLATARGQWLRMRDGLRFTFSREGRVLIARESDELLRSFERLTAQVERSMQVLMA